MKWVNFRAECQGNGQRKGAQTRKSQNAATRLPFLVDQPRPPKRRPGVQSGGKREPYRRRI